MNCSHIRPALRRSLLLAATLALLMLVVVVVLSAGRLRAQSLALAACPQAIVSGQIIWSSSCTVSTSLTVSTGATLVIGPGVVASFAPGAGLTVLGSLDARGTQARQVILTSATADRWPGIVIAPTAGDVRLQSATLANAQVGVTIAGPGMRKAARVAILDSLFHSNGIGIDANYRTNAGPRLTLRNTLFTNNGIGLRMTGIPNGNAKPKLTHNSFTANGIGVQVVNGTGQGLRARQQWWGSAEGPLDNTAACARPPAPGSSARDLVCGNVDAFPAAKVPAGRVILPPNRAVTVESAIGQDALSDNDLVATSILTLTVPEGAFSQTVDLIAAPRDFVAAPPGQPTALSFEITAAANGREIHQLAANRSLTLEIQYLPTDLTGADPRKLVIYSYDEMLQQWTFAGIRTTPDPANQRVIAHIDHLTRFSIKSVALSHVWLPLLAR